MDVHIGEVDATVRAVDDRSLLSPQILETIVREVLARLERDGERRRRDRDDASLWNSVREGRPT